MTLPYLYRPVTHPHLSAARAYALQHSDDYQRPTGAVIVDSVGLVVAVAANRSGLGQNVLSRTHRRWCLRRFVNSGSAYWLCPGCASLSGHAEARAAALVTGGRSDLTCYLWGHTWACEPCMNALAKVGVTTVVLEK